MATDSRFEGGSAGAFNFDLDIDFHTDLADLERFAASTISTCVLLHFCRYPASSLTSEFVCVEMFTDFFLNKYRVMV